MLLGLSDHDSYDTSTKYCEQAKTLNHTRALCQLYHHLRAYVVSQLLTQTQSPRPPRPQVRSVECRGPERRPPPTSGGIAEAAGPARLGALVNPHEPAVRAFVDEPADHLLRLVNPGDALDSPQALRDLLLPRPALAAARPSPAAAPTHPPRRPARRAPRRPPPQPAHPLARRAAAHRRSRSPRACASSG